MCRRTLSYCLVQYNICKQGIRSLVKFGCEEVRKTIDKCILKHLLKFCSSRGLLKKAANHLWCEDFGQDKTAQIFGNTSRDAGRDQLENLQPQDNS